MNTKNLLLSTLLGGVCFFFLGWLIFGILLSPIMQANCNNSINRPMEEMLFGPLILSNLLWALLLSLVLGWSQSTGWMGGFKTGAILGLILQAAMDLSFYSMTTFFNSMTGVVIDVIANTLFFGLVGAILGLVFFKPKRA